MTIRIREHQIKVKNENGTETIEEPNVLIYIWMTEAFKENEDCKREYIKQVLIALTMIMISIILSEILRWM